ncbi:MAG: metal ABC transporter ATP-binding protein [Pseudomonadota bacterium]
MSLIGCKALAVQFGGRTALSDVTVDVEPGEIVTLVGPNGSGKSTLLKALIGAVDASEGEVYQKPGLRIGYVPQRLMIDPTLPMTVARFLNLPKRIDQKKTAEALRQAGLPDLGQNQMSALSGGQFQRVLLARALLNAPEILILDEATQGLDQPGSADFYRQIETVRNSLGCAVLMVSHELHVVMSASDRVVCLNGHICCQGSPESVSEDPEYRALFGSGTHGALALYRHEHHGHRHDGIEPKAAAAE